MDDIKLGVYRHYKGKFYKVLGIVKHSETLEDMVLYETQYKNDLGKMWVRPRKMFDEIVTVKGKQMPRFEYISE